MTKVFTHLAAFAGRTEQIDPENSDSMMEKNGKLRIKSITFPPYEAALRSHPDQVYDSARKA